MAFRTNRQADKKQDKNTFPVRVASMDAELEFRLEKKATGQDLFDLVCRTIGLRETWYFGLQYMDSRGFITWLKMTKPVLSQDVPKQEIMQFMLLVKFFPEDTNEELIQDITIRLFFLQVKESILRMHVYCPAEIATMLASYACQAQYGDFDETLYRPGMLNVEELLPKRIIPQYQVTNDMWEDRIRNYYSGHKNMLREEAEMQYLHWAQNLLDMYGVNYFQIYNMRKSELWLGVTAFGLNVYDKDNRLTPKISFTWSEIRNISFEGKRFIIKPIDRRAPNFVFYSPKLRANKIILDLCMGNHDLYVRRRKPDTMELQQMRAQAKDLRMRRDLERSKLLHEKQSKQALQREKDDLERLLMQYQEEIRMANEALQRRSEQSAEMLSDKARLAEFEAGVFQQKADEAEKEVQLIRATVTKSEEEKASIQQQLQEAEHHAQYMVEEADARNQELNELRHGLMNARYAEKSAKDKLSELVSSSSFMTPRHPPPSAGNLLHHQALSTSSPQHQHHHHQQNFQQQNAAYNNHTYAVPPILNGSSIVQTSITPPQAVSPEFGVSSKQPPQYYASAGDAADKQQQRYSSHFPSPSTSSTVYAAAAGANPAMTSAAVASSSVTNSSSSPSIHSVQHYSPIKATATPVQPSTSHAAGVLRNQYVKQTFVEPSNHSSITASNLALNSIIPPSSVSGAPTSNGQNFMPSAGPSFAVSQQQLPTYEQHILLNGHNNSSYAVDPNAAASVAGVLPLSSSSLALQSGSSVNLSAGSGGVDDDIAELARQIDNENRHMMEKSSNLQRQLLVMRREFDGLRVDEQVTSLDRIHLDRKGETKHATLQKATQGATARRVAFFDKL